MDVWLYHDSYKTAYRSRFGAVPTGSTLTLRLLVKREDCQVSIRLWRDGNGETILKLQPQGDMYEVAFKVPEQGCLLWYYFIIRFQGKLYYYGNNREHLGGEGLLYDYEPPSYQITVYDKGAQTPDWFKHAVVYQIFPDRFYHGNTSTANYAGKKGAVLHSCWEDLPRYCKDCATGAVLQYDFFGGNIAGIREKLSYLKRLGVNTLYLNPIFEAASNHRYDTSDYHQIDPFLGTNEEFAAFCAEAKKKGMRIILDGVFSHTGDDSRYFNKYGTYPDLGAYQSKMSPYYEWYRFTNYPDKYRSWWGVGSLPEVEETTPSYMDFIINSEDSVLRHWVGMGISGWRLDVVDELPLPFLKRFYKVLKQENPEAILIGEVWEDASNKESYGEQRAYLSGQKIDSAMNYVLRKLMLQFVLNEQDAGKTGCKLLNLLENYPRENFYAMLNLIGSHDVERVFSLLAEGADRYDKKALATERLRLLSAWQLTMPGAPCIYYGDEVGVEGSKDPDNRRTYPWGRENKSLLSWYRKLLTLRNENVALQTGRFVPLYAEGDVYVYCRYIEGGADVFGKAAPDGFFIIALNRNQAEARCFTVTTDGLAYGELVDVLHPGSSPVPTVNGNFHLCLQPAGVAILKGGEPQQPKRAGVLLHPTSLPSVYGMGDLGKSALLFIDFLAGAGQKVWQVLPLNSTGEGDSPYYCLSAFAGNERLISLDALVECGWLSASQLENLKNIASRTPYSFEEIWRWKRACLWDMLKSKDFHFKWGDYETFCEEQSYWLEDYALYRALKEFFKGQPWTQWPEALKNREPQALASYKQQLSSVVFFYSFMQYLFFVQWQKIKNYAHAHGVSILGDVPIFVAHDSADCWAHQELFDLDAKGQPNLVAGVPPDYFSKTGQLWGNPLYRWDKLAATGYEWWVQRFKTVASMVDEVRIDHFRGFAACWGIKHGAATGEHGTWQPGPGRGFFKILQQRLPQLRLVAEDLGVITDDVCQLKNDLQLPGMKILHFHLQTRADGICALDTEPNCIAYTGTHDNNTTLGWYTEDLTDADREKVRELIGAPEDASAEEIVLGLIEYLYSRKAGTVIIPAQDLLTLPSSCRMNLPGTIEKNWHWQMRRNVMVSELEKWLAGLCRRYGR